MRLRLAGFGSALALTLGLAGLTLGQAGAALAASPADDFPPGKNFKSSMTVQNLDLTTSATITARFFALNTGAEASPGTPDPSKPDCLAKTDGGKGFGIQTQTAPPGEAVGYLPACFSGLNAGGRYSVVIEASRPVGIVTNFETDFDTTTGGLDASTTGSATGGSIIWLGDLNKGAFNGTQNSPFYLQNTSASTEATVDVELFKCDFSTLACSTTPDLKLTDEKIKPNATNEYQMTDAKFNPLSCPPPAGCLLTGRAISKTPGVGLAGSVLKLSPNGAAGASVFFTGGAKLSLPDINSDVFKINTPIWIQNVGTINLTDVKVTYYDSTTGAKVGEVPNIAIAVGSAAGRNPRNSSPENGFLQANKFYNAVVESATAGAQLTATVTKNIDDGTLPPRTTSAYEAILDPGALGKPVAFLPNINNLLCFQGICANSTLAATNLSATDDTVVQVTYLVVGGSGGPFREPAVTVPKGQSRNFKPSGSTLTGLAGQKFLAAIVYSYKPGTCAEGTADCSGKTPDGAPVSGLSNRNAVTDPTTNNGIEQPIGNMDGFLTYDALTA